MKFGSVQFFKRLIITGLLLVVLVLLSLAIVFGVLWSKQKQRADWLETVNWALLNSSELPEELQDAGDLTEYMQNPPAAATLGPSFEYQKDYLHLYTSRPEPAPTEGKVCYLTFDDGPSLVTLQVLKTLGDYDIKATFFVTGQNSADNPDILQAAAEAGHTVAVHTYSHDYPELYASTEAFLADFDKMYRFIEDTVGAAPGIFRFAGGSINAYNQYVYGDIIAEMTRRGFVFYDWNASASDAVEGGLSRQQVRDNVLGSVAGQERVIVLMHDAANNATTAQALPDIIEELAAQGYRFEPLTAEVEPITYFYQQAPSE